jgi:hypothetical protein
MPGTIPSGRAPRSVCPEPPAIPSGPWIPMEPARHAVDACGSPDMTTPSSSTWS